MEMLWPFSVSCRHGLSPRLTPGMLLPLPCQAQGGARKWRRCSLQTPTVREAALTMHGLPRAARALRLLAKAFSESFSTVSIICFRLIVGCCARGSGAGGT